MSFIYFIEGVWPTQGAKQRERIEEAGLGEMLPKEAGITSVRVTSGPEGRDGVVLGREALGARGILYKRDLQEWVKGKGTRTDTDGHGQARTEYRLGWWKDAPPTASSLRRPDAISGHFVELANGEQFEVPVVRLFQEGSARCALPRKMERNESGHWRPGTVVGKHAALWELAEAWCNAKLFAVGDGEGKAFDFGWDNLTERCIEILSCNYFVGGDECEQLGLISDKSIGPILDALVDTPTIEGWLKKKGASSGATT